MHRLTIPLFLLLLAWGARAECPPCGDMQCLNDPSFAGRRQAKKARLAQAGFPADWIKLVDKDGPCRLCLENAPDWFTLFILRSDGSKETKSWTREQENYARQDLASGKAKRVPIMYAQRRCACCGEKTAEQQPDWDSGLELSRSLAIELR